MTKNITSINDVKKDLLLAIQEVVNRDIYRYLLERMLEDMLDVRVKFNEVNWPAIIPDVLEDLTYDYVFWNEINQDDVVDYIEFKILHHIMKDITGQGLYKEEE